MPNLKGLALQNFRTFTVKEDLEFAPITLITGTNNAGKSSVFKAIQFLVHNYENGIVSETLDFKDMRHELGNLERIFNRAVMATFKNSDIQKNQSMYSRLSELRDNTGDGTIKLPIFEDDEDLVFAFPITLGSGREIAAFFEIRYDLNRIISKTTPDEKRVSHDIKSIAVVKDGKYLHWSNLIGYTQHDEDGPYWDLQTSIDLQNIIQLLLEALFKDKKGVEPNGKTEDYFTVDLFARIKKYKGIYFDLPFFNKKIDVYEDFIKRLSEGKYLFSDYSNAEADDKSKLLAIHENVTTQLLLGKSNSHREVLDSFKDSFTGIFGEMDRDIVREESREKLSDKTSDSNEGKNIRDALTEPKLQTTPNSQIFVTLLKAIEKDFLDAVGKTFGSLKNVYFLPTARGRNREWFIDEQNSEDIQIARDFSAIYLKHYKQIQNFVNFWIGKGEIDEADEKGQKKQKGFKIGKELYVFRDETIGLTKIFLVNFDGSKTPLVDLGYGVSQLLPIIMKIAIVAHQQQRTYEYNHNDPEGSFETTIYFSPSTLLIEEPEANLHPSLQSKIAELLIDAASRFNIQFLLETHSEYLIYKFQEYIGKKIVSPNDIKMYYFNHPNDVKEGLKEKYVNEVKIDEDGSIEYEKYFGEGFFDEQTNLKLSLLNIRRDRFIEDYESIKGKLIKSGETLKEYDDKINELNLKLSTTTSGKDELEKQLLELKSQKDQKESEFQTLIDEQERKIDEYTTKSDYSNYVTEIQTIIDPTKIDSSKTLRYLSTGKFLLKTLDSAADFAPVIIQYGRAMEFQMTKWVNDFKSSLSTVDKDTWKTEVNYKDKLIDIFNNLGITMPSTDTIGFNMGTINQKKICFYQLKTFTNNSDTKYKFGELIQIFELFYYISPATNATYNYNSVPLMVAFSDYLKNIWTNYDSAEGLFNTCRYILDLRNCAGHTYNDTVCANDVIDKSTAEDYVAKVEAILGCL
jgi:predicted ATPase